MIVYKQRRDGADEAVVELDDGKTDLHISEAGVVTVIDGRTGKEVGALNVVAFLKVYAKIQKLVKDKTED